MGGWERERHEKRNYRASEQPHPHDESTIRRASFGVTAYPWWVWMCRFSCCARRWLDPNGIRHGTRRAGDSRPTQGLCSASLHREGQVKGLGESH